VRNPIRLKNLRLRFLPFLVLGLLCLWLYRPTAPGLVIGGALVLLGGVLRTWGAGHLVKNDRLTISGPYAHLRHPLYAGTLLIAVGFAVVMGGVYALGLLALLLPWFFFGYFPRKERIEGDRLEEIYGPAYTAYREAVPALIPSLRPWQPAPETAAVANSSQGWEPSYYVDNNELGTLIAWVGGLVVFILRTQVKL
jgi:protein-S-isoprenylcysteine O-methyltransferase Ste14